MKVLVLFRGHSANGKSYLFNPFKINVFKIHSLKIFNLAQQNLSKLLCKNCAKQLKSIYRLRSYICFSYTFENDLLTKLTRVEHCDSIAQAKIDKKYPTDNTASKCYRDKNKLIYTYDNYDLYGSSKDEILQILNNIIESVESTENRNS